MLMINKSNDSNLHFILVDLTADKILLMFKENISGSATVNNNTDNFFSKRESIQENFLLDNILRHQLLYTWRDTHESHCCIQKFSSNSLFFFRATIGNTDRHIDRVLW